MKYKEIQEKVNVQLKNKKKQKLKEKGITLIALVVTIIILLILVGVTISQITGENGLIRKAKEAVEKYKNASEEELIQLGQLEQYVSDFEIIGGDEGEEKASVSIKENGLEVTGNVENKTITVKVTVIGEASGVEYKISSKEEWTERENEGTVKEGTEGDLKETEYTHTFNELKLGESYFVRVKVYDTNDKYVEALSNVITLNYIMTAEDGDVLEGRTYIGKNGTKSTGTMESRGTVNEILSAGEDYEIKSGYYDGGKITAGTEEIEKLKEQLKIAEENLANKENEMKSNKKVIEIKKGLSSKTTQTISLKEIEGYESFSANNFFIVCKELKYEFHSSVKDVLTISKSYNKDKGELTLGPLTSYFTLQNTNNGIAGVYIIYDVYYIE